MLDREAAKTLYTQFRSHRQGLRKEPQMASVCLICGSSDVVLSNGEHPHQFICRSCRFTFLRYACPLCGETVDARDPETPLCSQCGWCRCACQPSGPGCRCGSG